MFLWSCLQESPAQRASPTPVVAANVTVTTAKTIPAVTASQTLASYTVATFNSTEQQKVCGRLKHISDAVIVIRQLYSHLFVLQFIDVITTNIEKISGPVTVALSNIQAPGSVVFTTTVGFLNGDASSVAAYKTALTSSSSSIFGSSYAVQVDDASIADATVSNPSKCLHDLTCMILPNPYVIDPMIVLCREWRCGISC